MAVYYNCIMYISCRKVGWSEKYSMDAALVLPDPNGQNPTNNMNLDAVRDVFVKMIQVRAPLLGRECEIYAIRITRTTATGAGTRASELYWTSFLGSQDQSADNPPSDLVVLCANAANDKSKTIHMRGIWDGIDVAGGRFVPGGAAPNLVPQWTGLFNTWAATQAASPYGWFSVNQPDNVTDIVQVVQTIDDQVQINLDMNLFGLAVVGKRTQVRVTGCTGCANLNGTLLVKVLAQNVCLTVRKIPIFPYSGNGSMRWSSRSFIPIAVAKAKRIGSKTPGKPLPEFRGRRKARPLG